MRKHVWFCLTLLVVCAALVASAILLVDYLQPLPVFCDPDGGCETVKRTVYAYPLGVPMPAIGIVGIVGIAVAAMMPGRRATMMQLGLSVTAGVVALGLFAVQAQLGVLCPYCAIVDTSALLLASLAIVRFRTSWDPPRGYFSTLGSIMALSGAVIVPAGIGMRRPPKMPAATVGVPRAIADELAKSPKGVLTVVDFVDFECPFCRMTNATLEPLLAARKDKIRLVRKQVPLKMHPHAMDAARAGCCAEELGKGDAMAAALFSAPPDSLTPEGCEKLAETTGLDVARFRACVTDPGTDDRIASEKAMWKSANGRALPTIWIGKTEIVGAKPREVLEATLDKEIQAL